MVEIFQKQLSYEPGFVCPSISEIVTSGIAASVVSYDTASIISLVQEVTETYACGCIGVLILDVEIQHGIAFVVAYSIDCRIPVIAGSTLIGDSEFFISALVKSGPCLLDHSCDGCRKDVQQFSLCETFYYLDFIGRCCSGEDNLIYRYRRLMRPMLVG